MKRHNIEGEAEKRQIKSTSDKERLNLYKKAGVQRRNCGKS
jgi:hypothetical protein